MATPETTAPDTAPEAATYEVAIVGAGYVGVPLAQVFAEAGRRVVLVDVDARRVERLQNGDSYIEDVSSERLAELVSERGLGATTDYDVLRDVDAILIALPTPLSKQREPDLSIVRDAAAEIGKRLRAGQLVVLPRWRAVVRQSALASNAPGILAATTAYAPPVRSWTAPLCPSPSRRREAAFHAVP